MVNEDEGIEIIESQAAAVLEGMDWEKIELEVPSAKRMVESDAVWRHWASKRLRRCSWLLPRLVHSPPHLPRLVHFPRPVLGSLPWLLPHLVHSPTLHHLAWPHSPPHPLKEGGRCGGATRRGVDGGGPKSLFHAHPHTIHSPSHLHHSLPCQFPPHTSTPPCLVHSPHTHNSPHSSPGSTCPLPAPGSTNAFSLTHTHAHTHLLRQIAHTHLLRQIASSSHSIGNPSPLPSPR